MNTTRRHDIDALRALAFSLLILYHVGMFYVSWDWHVKSAYIATWLEPLMIFLNQWRMPLIFVISGLALNFLMTSREVAGSGRKLASSRTRRLLPPLLFGMLIIVPPQAYFEALSNNATPSGYGEFLVRYFTFHEWPENAFAGSSNGMTWNHLWYLPYLLLYSLLAIPLLSEHGRLAGIRRYWCARRSLSLYLLPVLFLLPIGLWVFPRFPYIRHDLISDFYAHAMFGTFFFLGVLTGRNEGLWQEIARLRFVSVGLGIATFTAYRLVPVIAADDPTFAFNALWSFVTYLNRWTWILVVCGFAHQHLNRPMGWLRYANRAVFPWYVFHQSVTVVAGALLSRLALGPVIEPVLVIGMTVLGCVVLMWLVERLLPWLSPLVGLKRRQPTSTAAGSPVGV